MKLLTCILFFIILVHAEKNSLYFETSPYLKQHADNPVHWIPYTEDVWEKARRENKPVYISIGYRACHWCHVMEKESFEDVEVARLLNQYFIAVKVDKEELLHIDKKYQKIYFDIYHARAGWPLNVFVTPQQKILYISGYIPKQSQGSKLGFLELLPLLQKQFQEKKYLQTARSIHSAQNETRVLTPALFKKSLLADYDSFHGGFGDAPKFPYFSKLFLLYDTSLLFQDKKLFAVLEESLHVMAQSGLYDHISGGFFRYCVDESWEIPHFEKMLYSQAQFLQLYSMMYRQTGDAFYAKTVKDIVAFVREWLSEGSMFYSSIDADLDTQEGGYYLFTSSIFTQKMLTGVQTAYVKGDKVHVTAPVNSQQKALLQKIRERRHVKPYVDKKVVTSWNAMMITALYEADAVDNAYGVLAQKHLQKLLSTMYFKGVLYHQRVLPHTANIRGYLEDYAYLIEALLYAYQYDYNPQRLVEAEYFTSMALHRFYKNGTWYLDDTAQRVEAEFDEKYYTSALAKMLEVLEIMALLKEKTKYAQIVEKSVSTQKSLLRSKLMQRYSFLLLKSTEKRLRVHKKQIHKIEYPYLYTKPINGVQGYTLCTIKQCYIHTQKLKTVESFIKSTIRK